MWLVNQRETTVEKRRGRNIVQLSGDAWVVKLWHCHCELVFFVEETRSDSYSCHAVLSKAVLKLFSILGKRIATQTVWRVFQSVWITEVVVLKKVCQYVVITWPAPGDWSVPDVKAVRVHGMCQDLRRVKPAWCNTLRVHTMYEVTRIIFQEQCLSHLSRSFEN